MTNEQYGTMIIVFLMYQRTAFSIFHIHAFMSPDIIISIDPFVPTSVTVLSFINKMNWIMNKFKGILLFTRTTKDAMCNDFHKKLKSVFRNKVA